MPSAEAETGEARHDHQRGERVDGRPALGDASDTMMAHPPALQLSNLRSLVEIGVDSQTAAGPVVTPNGGASAAPRTGA